MNAMDITAANAIGQPGAARNSLSGGARSLSPKPSSSAFEVSLSNDAADALKKGMEDWASEKNRDLKLLRMTFGIEEKDDGRPAADSEDTGRSRDKEGTSRAPAGDSGSGGAGQILAAAAETNETMAIGAEAESSDPIILDMDGDGAETTGIEGGALFDIDGDGVLERTSVAAGGDMFLAYDKNGDGVINSGRELFGDQGGAKNGFEELAGHDENSDGWIDKKDSIYDSLRLAGGAGENAFTISGSLSLREAGISAIGVSYSEVNARTAGGDTISQSSVYIRDDGTAGEVSDVLLRHRPII